MSLESKSAQTSQASHGFLRCFLIGEGIGIAITMVLLVIFSFFFSVGQLSLSLFWPFSMTAAGIGAAVAGLTSAKMRGGSGLLTGAVAGVLYYVILLLLGLMLHNGDYGIGLLIKLIVCVACGCIGGIFAVNLQPRKKYLK